MGTQPRQKRFNSNRGAYSILSLPVRCMVCSWGWPIYVHKSQQFHPSLGRSDTYRTNDYPKSTGAIYSLRAIENGFTMIRPVYNGFSYAVDHNGKLLASMDSDNTNTGIMYADVPIKGVNTLYATVGDLLGWLCVFGLLGLILLTIVLNIRNKRKMPANYGVELPST